MIQNSYDYDKRKYSVHPRYSAGSPALVDRRTAMDVLTWERQCYERALEGIYGGEKQAKAKALGLSGIVEHHDVNSHHINFYDLMTGEFGIRKDGHRTVKGTREDLIEG